MLGAIHFSSAFDKYKQGIVLTIIVMDSGTNLIITCMMLKKLSMVFLF